MILIEREVKQHKDSAQEDEEKKISIEVEEVMCKGILDSSDLKVPPPPQISSPSPPPPPRICAEDLKRGKKRKGSQEIDLDNKKEKLEQGEFYFDTFSIFFSRNLKFNSQVQKY